MTPSSEATPRPQILRDCIDDAFSAIGTEPLTDAEVGPMLETLTAALEKRGYAILAAVNSYDESRKLLREAAGWIETLDDDAFGYIENDDHEVPTCWPVKRELLARIRAHLEGKND